MGIYNLFSGIDIVKSLISLDSKLKEPDKIILAGSAVPILAGCAFRHTADIDFAFLPSETIYSLINQDPELYRIFDFRAQGIIGMLEDAEDRLVTVDLGLSYLVVQRLSLMDWVVSKLASPKLEDVLNVKEVTLSMLLEIEKMFHFYCGISINRAYSDLKFLISEFKERTVPIEISVSGQSWLTLLFSDNTFSIRECESLGIDPEIFYTAELKGDAVVFGDRIVPVSDILSLPVLEA